IFYIVCGLLAGLSHVFSSVFLQQSLLIPRYGASGAISGVLAGYMLLFPRKRIHIWILLGIVRVPAVLAVGLWFLFQLINGAGALGGEEAGGIAYAAHIGGFIAGLLLVKIFVPRATSPVR
ncbi:MAG: rhomboid family intramembrane serine protease, partial [Chitinophagaceae bacterium]